MYYIMCKKLKSQMFHITNSRNISLALIAPPEWRASKAVAISSGRASMTSIDAFARRGCSSSWAGEETMDLCFVYYMGLYWG